MALVLRKPVSLKEKLLAAASKEDDKESIKEATAEAEKASCLVQVLPVIAEAAKQEVANTVVDQAPASDSPVYDMAAQQAYADILPRIESLSSLSGEDLSKEMGILKKALIENPDACAIMLPTDIGKMVAALRTITGMALVEAAAPKAKGGKKPKQLLLTPEAMEAAFNEL